MEKILDICTMNLPVDTLVEYLLANRKFNRPDYVKMTREQYEILGTPSSVGGVPILISMEIGQYEMEPQAKVREKETKQSKPRRHVPVWQD